MPSVRAFRRVSSLLVLALAAAFAPAQEKQEKLVELRYPIPDKIERPTKKDDQGLEQWAEFTPVKCQSCAGTGKTGCTTCQRYPDDWTHCMECKRTKEAVCRPCAGVGTYPDPLEKVLCPACFGAAFLPCMVCPGSSGKVRIQGGGDRAQNCPACRGDGGYKCVTCNGARLVEVAALKPSLKDAQPKDLAKALQTTEQALAAVSGFTPDGKNSRKQMKEFSKILAMGQSVYPPLKRAPKAFEDYMGKIFGGANFQGHEEGEANAMNAVRSHTEYYLKHQKRMLELAQKRAEANAKVQAEQKAK